MRVLHVNNSNSSGGAARAAIRLHEALLNNGIKSYFYSLDGNHDGISFIKEKHIWKLSNKLLKILQKVLLVFLRNNYSSFTLPLSTNKRIVKIIDEYQIDIIHLHWSDQIFFNVNSFELITKPIIWTMHDMNVFTGGCHYSQGCVNYTIGCDKCPAILTDLGKKTFLHKKQILSQKNITLIALSRWMYDCAKSSAIVDEEQIVKIPNLLNTDIFAPKGKFSIQKRSQKTMLFGAMSATSDLRKGYVYIEKLLEVASTYDMDFRVECFGSDFIGENEINGVTVNYLGEITSDEELIAAYSRADVFVVPSIEENLSNAIMEAMSCATGVLAFDIGGNGDMIEHKKSGYLASPYSVVDLAAGLEFILSNTEEIGRSAREKVLKSYSSVSRVTDYIHLYQKQSVNS